LASCFGQPFFPTQLYPFAISICVLLPLCALALDMRTKGALGFEERRSRRYPLSLATILVLPALALGVRAGIDLNFESYAPLITAAVLFAGVIFAIFWRFDPQLRGDFNQYVSIAIFALAYSYGALAFADVKLDASSGHDTQTVAFMSQVDQKAARFGIRSKWIPKPRPRARTGSTSNPISGTPSTETTSSACTLARAFSQSLGTPSAAALNKVSGSNPEPPMSALGQKRT
jgi:hypothetical protein